MITKRQEKRLQRQRDKEMRRYRRQMAAFKASPKLSHDDIVKADFAQLEARQAARNHNIVPIAALITLRLNHD